GTTSTSFQTLGTRQSASLHLLQELPLRERACTCGFFAHLLKERFKLAFLHRGNQRRVIGLDPQLIDWHRQFHVAIQLHHFPVLSDLLARVEQPFPCASAFHVIDPCHQPLQST